MRVASFDAVLCMFRGSSGEGYWFRVSSIFTHFFLIRNIFFSNILILPLNFNNIRKPMNFSLLDRPFAIEIS